MIDTERKEDLLLDTKLIKSENKLDKLRIIDELHPVLGGQPTHEKDQPNDNNPILDLACTMQFTIDKADAIDKKADTKLAKAQNLKDVANIAIARDNLGLGTSATMNATSTLSDRTDQTATIKVVNDVNRAANNAQTSANNANNKANAAQTRADSAYNLANSANNNANTRLEKSKNLSDLTNVATARTNLGLKSSATLDATSTLSDRTDQTATIKVVNDVNRSAVTAQKTANNAHALAQSKQDKLNFNKNDWEASAGDVLKSGFGGIGQKAVSIGTFNWSNPFGFNGFQYEGSGDALGRPTGASSSFAINLVANENYALQIGSGISQNKLFFRHKHKGDWQNWKLLLSELDIANNLGTSTTLVASQKLVNDVAISKQSLNKKIKDVTSIRTVGSTYTNTTSDVIEVYVKTGPARTSDIFAYINNQEILYNSFSGSQGPIAIYFNVYPGESYSVRTYGEAGHDKLIFWKERAI